MSNTPTNRPELTREIAAEMAGALHTIVEIETRAIKLKDDEANLAAARNFLGSKLFTHCSELLGSWFAIADEYQPMLNVFARMSLRIDAINRRYIKSPTAVVEGQDDPAK